MKALVTITTCIHIMMVDLPALFPRYHCKCEDAGWSMMDIGVSAIMFASGFSSGLIVTHKAPSKKRPPLIKRIVKALTGNIGVTIGASVRFLLLHGIDYHEHVTEWGCHWNFFVTIACMNLFMAFIPSANVCLPLGLLVLFMSDILKRRLDLDNYVYFAPRDNFVSANKEGLVSLDGFFAI